jgi:hypothetical protein
MKAHPSLSRLCVISKGPAAMVLMIASEFGRAGNRSEQRENVLNCYRRARELMGVLETVALPLPVAESLKPWFAKSSQRELFAEERLHPSWVQKFCTQAAAAFNQAASHLSQPSA